MAKKISKKQVEKKLKEHKKGLCFICGADLTKKKDVMSEYHSNLGTIMICKNHK